MMELLCEAEPLEIWDLPTEIDKSLTALVQHGHKALLPSSKADHTSVKTESALQDSQCAN